MTAGLFFVEQPQAGKERVGAQLTFEHVEHRRTLGVTDAAARAAFEPEGAQRLVVLVPDRAQEIGLVPPLLACTFLVTVEHVTVVVAQVAGQPLTPVPVVRIDEDSVPVPVVQQLVVQIAVTAILLCTR